MSQDTHHSADRQALDRIIPLLEDHTNLDKIIDTLTFYRMKVTEKDELEQRHVLRDHCDNRAMWMRQYRTFVYNFGRMSGSLFMAQLMTHKKMVVLVIDGPAEGFENMRPSRQLQPLWPESLYDGVQEATVVRKPGEFIEALASGTFESAMIYGSRALLGLNFDTDPTAFLDLVGSHLRSDLPFIHVIN